MTPPVLRSYTTPRNVRFKPVTPLSTRLSNTARRLSMQTPRAPRRRRATARKRLAFGYPERKGDSQAWRKVVSKSTHRSTRRCHRGWGQPSSLDDSRRGGRIGDPRASGEVEYIGAVIIAENKPE
jgi:hypothetical protein